MAGCSLMFPAIIGLVSTPLASRCITISLRSKGARRGTGQCHGVSGVVDLRIVVLNRPAEGVPAQPREEAERSLSG